MNNIPAGGVAATFLEISDKVQRTVYLINRVVMKFPAETLYAELAVFRGALPPVSFIGSVASTPGNANSAGSATHLFVLLKHPLVASQHTTTMPLRWLDTQESQIAKEIREMYWASRRYTLVCQRLEITKRIDQLRAGQARTETKISRLQSQAHALTEAIGRRENARAVPPLWPTE